MGTVDQHVNFVENDNGPDLAVNYNNVDVSAYPTLRLHVRYKPNAIALDGVIFDEDNTSFYFQFASRVSGTLAAAAHRNDTVVQVDGASFALLPASGELLIDSEQVLYSSKSGSNILHLVTPLVSAHALNAAFEKMPDLRAGTWEASLETVDNNGLRVTFPGFALQVREAIP